MAHNNAHTNTGEPIPGVTRDPVLRPVGTLLVIVGTIWALFWGMAVDAGTFGQPMAAAALIFLGCAGHQWENLKNRFSARQISKQHKRAKHRLRPLFMRSLRRFTFSAFRLRAWRASVLAHPSLICSSGRVRPSESSGTSSVMQEAAPT